MPAMTMPFEVKDTNEVAGLAPGDYAVEVRVRDHVSGQSLVQSAKFTIVP